MCERVGAVIANRQGEIISGGFNHFSNGISCEAKFFSEYSRDVYPETARIQDVQMRKYTKL